VIDHKEFERRVRLRRLAPADYPRVVELQRLCFPKMASWELSQFESMLKTFPDGQIGGLNWNDRRTDLYRVNYRGTDGESDV